MDDGTFKKEKRKTSFFRDAHFLSHLITSAAVTLVLLGLVILGLPHFPGAERLISPSVIKIEAFQKEIGVLKSQTQALDLQLKNHTEKLSEVESLKSQTQTIKEALNSFSKSLSELESKFEKFRQLTPEGQLNFLQEGLSQIQQRIDKGEAFSEVLHALIAKVKSDKDLMDVVHKLTVYANDPTKTLFVLAQELGGIQGQLLAQNRAPDQVTSEEKNWWTRLKIKMKNLVSIHKVGGDEKTLDVGQESEVLEKIDQALSRLREQDLNGALDLIRTQAAQHKGIFSSWLQDAERRKSLEDAFSLFKKQLAPLLTRSS